MSPELRETCHQVVANYVHTPHLVGLIIARAALELDRESDRLRKQLEICQQAIRDALSLDIVLRYGIREQFERALETEAQQPETK